MFIFHYIKKDGLNTIPRNQVCHLIAALGLCEIFKQETRHKPEWCELEPYDPAHIVGPQGVVPWADSHAGQPYAGYILRNKNQHHINQSVAYGPPGTAEPVLPRVLQSRKPGKPAVDKPAYGKQERPHAVDGKHNKGGAAYQPPVPGHNGVHRGKHDLQAPSCDSASAKVKE